MLIGTVFGVFVIPVFFVVFQIVQEKISGAPKLIEEDNEVAIEE